MKRLLLTMTVASAVLCAFQTEVRAQGCGYGGYGGGAFWGINRLYNNPYYPSDRRIPYFAEHPPVYYSYPVPRTYGYSPYASPPTYTAPQVRADPVTISNPYVPQAPAEPAKAERSKAPTTAKGDKSAATKRTPGPLMVFNPFVTDSRGLALAHSASQPK